MTTLDYMLIGGLLGYLSCEIWARIDRAIARKRYKKQFDSLPPEVRVIDYSDLAKALLNATKASMVSGDKPPLLYDPHSEDVHYWHG